MTLVWGRTANEQRLVAVCERLKQHGLTADAKAENLGVDELTFFGLKV